jgi:predicted amidohydrolase YtcJ
MRERLWFNANVRTMDPTRTRATAVVTVGDRIAHIGDAASARAWAHPGAEEIDLGGATMLPGFVEAHNHMIMYGLNLAAIDARYPGVTAIADITRAVAARAASQPAGTWIRSFGYDDNKLAEKRHPSRQDLDAVAPDHPVVLVNGSGHMAVANSLALRLAGIDRDTPDPMGGHIVKDAAGEPTGLLQETAQSAVRDLVPKPSVHDMVEALRACAARYMAAGITSSHTATVSTEQEMLAHQLAAESGACPVRTYLMVHEPLLDTIDALGIKTGFGDDRLRVGPIKFFCDGSLIGRTAAVTVPFLEDPNPGNLGLEMQPAADLERLVQQAHDAGFQVAIHAIGDRGIDIVVTAYEKALAANPRADHRHRIEHCGINRPDLLDRIQRGGFIAVSQPIFITEYGDGFLRHLGRERCQLTYPFRTFLDRNIPLVLSSDCPVSAFEPLKGMAATILEQTGSGQPYAPQEALTIDEAVYGYTMAGAYAAFEEDRKGSIEVGKLADFAILARDPWTVDPRDLPAIPVAMTVIGGQITHAL